MSSIPLPALHLDAQQAPDLMSQYGNLLKLQSMRQGLQQQQQLAPLQMQQQQNDTQASQLNLQQQQQAAKDAAAGQAAMKAWDPKDGYDALSHLFVTNGGSMDGAMKIQATAAQQKLAASKQALADAQTGSAQLETQLKKNDIISGALSPLLDPKQVPDAQLPQAVVQTAQSLSQQGLLDPQHVQMAAQLAQSGDPNKIRQGLDVMRKGMMANSQILAEAKDKAATVKDTAQAQEATVNTQLAPQLAASKLAFQRAQLAQGQQRNSMSQQRLDLAQQQAGVTPGGMPSTLAQDIASGHIPLDRMGYLLARNPGLVQGVMQIDPTFDGSKAAAYPQVYKDFTNSKPGTAGGALLTGSTALQHLKELQDMNTDASHIPGTAAYNAYQNKAETVASELDRFYHGTSTDTATANIKKTLVATLPGQRQAAIATQAQSMGDRLDNYEQTWKNAAPSSKYEAPMPGISQTAIKARAALDPSYAQRMRQTGSEGQQDGMVTVQIPGLPPGHIPAAAVAKFKADHPNATVTQ